MSYVTSWLLEQRIVLMQITGAVSPSDLKASDLELVRYIDDSHAPHVHIVFDMSQSTRLPGFSHLSGLTVGKHPRLGKIVIVGKLNPLVRVLVLMTGTLFSVQLRIVPEMDEAVTHLYRIDKSLPAMPALENTAERS